jgi:hypothetical protein
MKKTLRIITGIIAWAVISSCSAGYDYYIPAHKLICGTVTDTEGNLLNHIKISFDCGEDEGPMSVYTSLKGEFIADLATDATIISIKVEDIDGEDNGGLFETITDQITILEDNLLKEETITLEYRLSRATVSESSPQSW